MEKKIFLVGDSTVAYNDISTYPQTGWGQTISLYLQDDITIQNHAKNGRSSKSFLDEGRLEPVAEQIQAGDYLFIQFGHNDQKPDEARATEPFTSYQAYLKQYIALAREHQAYPVLITSPYRRHFSQAGVIKELVHGEYPAAMMELAASLGVPVIDLCEKSKQLLAKLGDELTKQLFMHLPGSIYTAYPDGKVDDTHFRYEGAIAMAGLVVDGLKELGSHYSELVK